MQTTAAYSPWQIGRVEQRIATSKEVAGKTNLQRKEVYGRTDGTRGCRSPSEGGGRRRRAGKTFHHSGVTARGLGRTCCFESDQKSSCHTFPANENIRAPYSVSLLQTLPRQTSGDGNASTISGTSASIGPQLFTCEETRQTKADCLSLERRQLDELLKAAREVRENYEDLTSQPGPPPPLEVTTEPPREPEEPSRDDLDIGLDAVDQMTPFGRSRRNSVITRNPLRGDCWKSSDSKGIVWRSLTTNNRKPEWTKQN